MNALEALCNSNKRVLAVSHPFACQVACNTMLGVNQVSLVKFWFRKGALVLFENKDGWKFKKAFNLLEDQELTFQDIYTELVV
jgi:hypothetical protein